VDRKNLQIPMKTGRQVVLLKSYFYLNKNILGFFFHSNYY
jgi:hypothetical protein